MWQHGRSITGGEYLMAVTTLQAFTRRVAAAMADFDVWLSPTVGTPPPLLGAIAGTDEDPWRGNDGRR